MQVDVVAGPYRGAPRLNSAGAASFVRGLNRRQGPMYDRSLQFASRLLLLGGALLAGCSGGDRPELGYVSGTVTMDGEPLVGVIVTFKPEQGRPAVDVTDADGC